MFLHDGTQAWRLCSLPMIVPQPHSNRLILTATGLHASRVLILATDSLDYYRNAVCVCVVSGLIEKPCLNTSL